MKISKAASEMGRKGGAALLQKYGTKHFQEMARKSHLSRSLEVRRKKIQYNNSKI